MERIAIATAAALVIAPLILDHPAEAAGLGRLRFGRVVAISPPPPPPPPPPPVTVDIVNGAVAGPTGWPVTNCDYTGSVSAGGVGTCQPAPSGNPAEPEYSLYPILAWSDPQIMTLEGDYAITVIAGHEPTDTEYAFGTKNNITRVEVSCNGGPVATSTAIAANPVTGVVGFNFTLKTSTFPNNYGFECRATGYASTGTPRTLQGPPTTGVATMTLGGLTFNSRTTGALSPVAKVIRYVEASGIDTALCGTTPPVGSAPAANACATISFALTRARAANGTLDEGIHVIVGQGVWDFSTTTIPSGGGGTRQWLTFEGRDDVAKSLITLKGMGPGYRAPRVHVKHFSVGPAVGQIATNSPTSLGIPAANGPVPMGFWAEDMAFTGWNRFYSNWREGGSTRFHPSLTYITESTLTNQFCVAGVALVRNVSCTIASDDTLSDVGVTVNFTGSRLGGTFHVNGGPTPITATVTAGSNVVVLDNMDDIANNPATGLPFTGARFFADCGGGNGIGSLNTTRGITAINTTTKEVTVDGAPAIVAGGGTCNTQTTGSGQHVDVSQFKNNGSTTDNRILQDIIILDRVSAACVFTDQNAKTLVNIWINRMTCDNQDGWPELSYNFRWSNPVTNMFISDYNWATGTAAANFYDGNTYSLGTVNGVLWQDRSAPTICLNLSGNTYAPYGLKYHDTPASACALHP